MAETNGTILSYDGNKNIIDSVQLNGDEFMAITGCFIDTPANPPPDQPDACWFNDDI